jgi:magnesium transporter
VATAAAPRRSSPSKKRGGGRADSIRGRRFDADHKDVILSFEDVLATKPSDRQLIWLDIQGSLDAEESAALEKRFGLDRRTAKALEQAGSRPHLAIHGDYFHVRVAAQPAESRQPHPLWLDLVAGRGNVAISRHEKPVGFLAKIDDRVELDADVGSLSSGAFLALILDGAVTTYFQAVDRIEDDVDALDAQSLGGQQAPNLLNDLVALRRRVAALRSMLAWHREVFAALADTAILQAVDDEDASAALVAVGERFHDAVAAVEDARDVLIGSFDVLMTRTAQRTNDVMKLLAVATVLLLPGSLIAGLLGMNVAIPLSKDDPASFWLVVASVVILAILIVGILRLRRWL